MSENARVRYTNGSTINLGDFNSWRCDVGLEMPVPSPGGEVDFDLIDEVYEFASEWVEAKLQAKVDEQTDALNE